MTVYFLTRESHPKISKGQKTIVLECLQPAGTRKTLDQLVNDCLKHGYAKTLKHPPKPEHLRTEIVFSVLYHIIDMRPLVESEERT